MPQPSLRKPDPKTKTLNDKRVSKGPSGGAKPTTSERAPVPCLECGLCCTYLAFEINGPTTVKRASEILWHLYHERVSVYRDSDDEWFVQMETRCQHLQADNKCGIYETRPHVCREYSEKTCEINSQDAGMTFYNAAEFLEFMSTNRRRVHKQLLNGFASSTPEAMNTFRKKKNGDFKKRLTVLRG